MNKLEVVWAVCGYAYGARGSAQIPQRLFKYKKGAREFLKDLDRDAQAGGLRTERIKDCLFVFSERGRLSSLTYYYIEQEYLIDTYREC